MKACVVVYPGSNCDRDVKHALEYVGIEAIFVNTDSKLDKYDLIILPGGFSYGDYLRPGAIAAREKIAFEIEKSAEKGKLIFGICNGFQILIEMNLLPGALLRNENGKFVCKWVNIIVEDTETPFTTYYKKGEIIRIPIAHGFGRYVKTMENPRVIMRYEENINGSDEKIAAIANKEGNILGMMPHPERAYEKSIGGEDGLRLFLSVVDSFKEGGF